MKYEIRATKPTKAELRDAGFPRKHGVKPVKHRLRCCVCGRFVSARSFAFDFEGYEDGLICPPCNVENEPLDDQFA